MFSTERCASLIAHEHGHLMGLEHVEGPGDLMTEGACTSCGGRLAGRWQKFGKPFGSRRIPVRLSAAA